MAGHLGSRRVASRVQDLESALRRLERIPCRAARRGLRVPPDLVRELHRLVRVLDVASAGAAEWEDADGALLGADSSADLELEDLAVLVDAPLDHPIDEGLRTAGRDVVRVRTSAREAAVSAEVAHGRALGTHDREERLDGDLLALRRRAGLVVAQRKAEKSSGSLFESE